VISTFRDSISGLLLFRFVLLIDLPAVGIFRVSEGVFFIVFFHCAAMPKRRAQRFRFGNFESIHASTTSLNSGALFTISSASLSVATCDRV
jgi:hypothetical protein